MHALPSHPKHPLVLGALVLVLALLVMAAAEPDLSTLDFSLGGPDAAGPAPAGAEPGSGATAPTWATDPLAAPVELLGGAR